ncbi:MAG: hypothetical protein M1832_002795 [Thelocarpon impressellum]|nr:MAG: hypothetical protein M1832_002795 [Thelocarpon impressellum]
MEASQRPFSPLDDRPIDLDFPSYADQDPAGGQARTFAAIKHFLSLATVSTATDYVAAAAAAAEELVRPTNQPAAGALPLDDSMHPANYVFAIFSNVLAAASQIPPDHVWRWRLVALVRALSALPPPPPAAAAGSEAFGAVWASEGLHWDRLPTLPTLWWEVFAGRGRWDDPRGRMEEGRWTRAEWLNVNAFAALLVADRVGAGEGALSFDESGMRLLRHVLDEERDAEGLDDNVPPAAAWVLTTGAWLHERVGPGPGLESRGDVVGREGEERGAGAGESERWRSWKGQFGRLAADDRLADGTKAWARRAVDHMAQVDGSA